VKNPLFKKDSHVGIIEHIAGGLQKAGSLNDYLELGIRNGSCFNQVAPHANQAFAVDIDKKSYGFIKGNKNLQWHCGTTDSYFDSLAHTPQMFDLVFIDADHCHESSFSDFCRVLPFVRNNGLVLLHDTYPPDERYVDPSYCADTYKTPDAIKTKFPKEIEMVTLPFFHGVSIVRKHMGKQLAWQKN